MRWFLTYTLGGICLAVLQSLQLNGYCFLFRIFISFIFAALALFIYEYRKEMEK